MEILPSHVDPESVLAEIEQLEAEAVEARS